MRPRRALLYVPGSDWRKIEKAAALDVDVVCMDLEDGTALNRKAEARQTILQALTTLDFGGSERLLRINPVGSGLEQDDLEAVLSGKPDGVVIPKASSADEIQWVSEQLNRLEREHGIESGATRLWALVETARAVVNLKEIASADARLVALIFGALDFAVDVGAKATPEASEVFYARSAVVAHAAAFGLDAIDMVSVDFKDMDALRAEASYGARLGFAGKQIIHPDQIAPVQAAFTPSEGEVAEARRIVAAHEEHQQKGAGAFALDGKMVDMPVVRAAQRALARADLSKKQLHE
jgi:citrate lyase beta subunit